MSQNFSDVFIPGGIPTVTYNPRTRLRLEDKIREAKNNLCKLVVVTGQTKAGKTVLVDRIFPQNCSVWISGGSVESEEDFWGIFVECLNLSTHVDYVSHTESENTLGGEVASEIGISLFKAKPSLTVQTTKSCYNEINSGRNNSNKIVALNHLSINKTPVIIDDFHYISKDIQAKIVRALKNPIMRGVPVILIAIPNRKYDAVKVEREMTGRIEHIDIPQWSEDELSEIAFNGFKHLNVQIAQDVVNKMTREAFGSPHLMQEFCKALCRKYNIIEKNFFSMTIPINDNELEKMYTEIAQNTGRPTFDRLARGARPRSDRKERLLTDGTKTDIYRVVMMALKSLRPGMSSISYEELRSAIKEHLQESPPQRHEITRVLDIITQISYNDSASTPVIEWNKEDSEIHITDPFFAFYLKWAV